VLVFRHRPRQTYTGWFHVLAAAIVLAGLIDVARETGR
jgi:hypothetical protein